MYTSLCVYIIHASLCVHTYIPVCVYNVTCTACVYIYYRYVLNDKRVFITSTHAAQIFTCILYSYTVEPLYKDTLN